MKIAEDKIIDNFNKIEDFLFESHSCICCMEELDTNNNYRLCSNCLNKINFTKNNFCLKCGEITNGDYDYCITCKNKEYYFDYARSVFAYDKTTAPIIMKFKYNGKKNFAKPLAYLLKDYYSSSDIIADVATFVPMPEKRFKERGYNQGEELCKEFCLLTGMPMISSLKRVKEITKQATLNAKEREENIKGSFECINKSLVKNKEILLIDDVLTTGATASECAKTLLKAGANNVIVLTIAKTPALDFDKTNNI